MTKKIEQTEGSVIKATEEITPKTVETVIEETELEKVITVNEAVVDEEITSKTDEEPILTEAPEGEVGPTIPPKEGENFKEKLEIGQIVVGTKISYVVSGAEVPTEVIVDEAFLSLPIQKLEYYEKFNYKIVK